MTNLIKIGNSQGIRIPKVLIEQAGLQDKSLSLSVVENGLLIEAKATHRQGWDTLELRKKAKTQEDELIKDFDNADYNDEWDF